MQDGSKIIPPLPQWMILSYFIPIIQQSLTEKFNQRVKKEGMILALNMSA